MKITPENERRITELIEKMTLEEKVLQMLQISNLDAVPDKKGVFDKLVDLGVGSVFHIIYKGDEGIRAREAKTRLGIPPLLAIDAIHGHSLYNGATIFPSQLAMSCSWNEELIEAMGAATAKEVNADGIDWVFSPVLCIARDTRWGRVDETFGEDPYLIGRLGAAIVRGYEKDGLVISCLKHYIGYGEATGARDAYDTELTIRKVRETFLPPFEDCIKEGAGNVMTAYGSIDATSMTAHKKLLREVLKDELGFGGFVVTDYFNIWSLRTKQRAAESFDDACRMAIEAGNDMSMNCYEFYDSVVKQVRDGKISEELINDAVRRILRVKFHLGLFDGKPRMPQEVIGCSEHRALNHALTRESLVLLKNNGALPIKEAPKKIAVIGPNADDVASQYGDWTFTSHRPEEEFKTFKSDPYTLLRGMKEVFAESEIVFAKGCSVRTDASDGDDINEALALAKDADLVVLALGDDITLNGEYKDRANLELSGRQNELARRIKELGKPIVTVLITGKPLCINEVADISDALIQMFNGGDLGGLCAAELIAGRFNPSGKLTISFPRASGALPCYYNQYSGWHGGKYADVDEGALFDFGYGLSFTEYTYSNLTVDKESIALGGTLTVSVDVENTGNFDGQETVELYYNDVISSTMTPSKNLKRFKKVFIPAGGKKSVTFTLTTDDFSFISPDERRVTEKGEIEIFVGGSLDTLLKTSVKII